MKYLHYLRISTKQNYYAFGSPMAGRTVDQEDYRFGFNGQERDDDISGTGNINMAEYWEYDARLGRRWNLDPVLKVWESPYATFSDNPIWFSDPNGDNATGGGGGTDDGKSKSVSKLTGSKSLIVFLLDEGLELAKQTTDFKTGKWDYVAANTLEEAEKIIKDKYGDKTGFIDNLYIRSHGQPGAMVNNGNPVWLSQTESPQVKSLKYLESLLTDDASVLLSACNITMAEGGKKNGVDYAQLFTNGKMGRNFYGNTAATMSSQFINTNDDKLIGAKGDLVFPRMNQYLIKKKYGGFVWYFHGDKIGGVMSMKDPYNIKVNSQTGTIDKLPIKLDPGAIFNR